MTTSIYYDGDCPFCSKYVQLSRLRASVGRVDLIDLRSDTAARTRFAAQGLDPDQGMIVETEGGVFHGADAVQAISAMSSKSGFLNRLAATIFGNRLLATMLYPFMRAGRNATLFAMGREPMRADDVAEAAHFNLFARFFGLFLLLHVIYYLFRAAPDTVQPTSIPLLILGAGLVLVPQKRRMFIGALLVLAADSWLHAPAYSNHTMLLNFLLLTFLVAGAWHMLRGSSWVQFFADVRPVGRVLLLIMYTFGIFHKINTDFLNPATSCAVALWRQMPPPLVWLDNAPMHYLAIYGTFAVEGLIMLMLIVPRWRHWGICFGMGFHAVLALSGFAMYPVFTTLAIVLHVLFISPDAALRITQSDYYRRLDSFLRRPTGVAFLLVAVAMIGVFAMAHNYRMVAFIWLTLAAWPLTIIALKGAERTTSDKVEPQLWAPTTALNLISILFFLNCFSPYFGLKTAQSMNMFANLRIEGGVNNHLVIRHTLGPLSYIEDLITLTQATGAPKLELAANTNGTSFVYYHFLDMLEDAPAGAQVAFIRDGQQMPLTPVSEILARDGAMLHPEWMRKFIHFLPVRTELPLPC